METRISYYLDNDFYVTVFSILFFSRRIREYRGIFLGILIINVVVCFALLDLSFTW
jgi:hypothetical protein